MNQKGMSTCSNRRAASGNETPGSFLDFNGFAFEAGGSPSGNSSLRISMRALCSAVQASHGMMITMKD